jgi:hypothetical protein
VLEKEAGFQIEFFSSKKPFFFIQSIFASFFASFSATRSKLRIHPADYTAEQATRFM